MRKSQFTEGQIIGILKLVAAGQKVGDVCHVRTCSPRISAWC